MAPPAFTLRQVKQIYSGQTVLRIESLDIPSHCILGIFGPNGSGKSTLLRILALLEDPVQGQITFQGKPCSSASESQRRRITLLDQNPYLMKRSVAANVAYGLKVRGIQDRSRVEEALHMVGLEPAVFSRRKWFQLSGGEAQRVALAARLVLQPQVLILDEPTASLDVESTERIRQAIFTARQTWDTTVILVSHDQKWLSEVTCTTLALRKGRIENFVH